MEANTNCGLGMLYEDGKNQCLAGVSLIRLFSCFLKKTNKKPNTKHSHPHHCLLFILFCFFFFLEKNKSFSPKGDTSSTH